MTRRPLPLIGAGAAVAVGAAGVRTALRTDEHPSWPPPPDAITPDGAMAAVAEFASGDPRPGDVGLAYARSTAATIEPWAGGADF